jgi:hypothetical protein
MAASGVYVILKLSSDRPIRLAKMKVTAHPSTKPIPPALNITTFTRPAVSSASCFTSCTFFQVALLYTSSLRSAISFSKCLWYCSCWVGRAVFAVWSFCVGRALRLAACIAGFTQSKAKSNTTHRMRHPGCIMATYYMRSVEPLLPTIEPGRLYKCVDAYSGRSGPPIPPRSGPLIPVTSGPLIPPASGPPIPV